MNRGELCNDFGHDDSTINIVMAVIIIIIITYAMHSHFRSQTSVLVLQMKM